MYEVTLNKRIQSKRSNKRKRKFYDNILYKKSYRV